MDQFNLEKASFIGGYWGGSILIRLASFAPERIVKAILIVPSAIANNSTFRIIKDLAIPMIAYRMFPTQKRLLRAIHPIASEPHEDSVEMIKAVFHHVKVKAGISEKC